jgi:hypothetical protein
VINSLIRDCCCAFPDITPYPLKVLEGKKQAEDYT